MGKKVRNDMIIALVEYVNRYGKISMKSFTDETDLAAFVKKLETKGTQHLVTRCE